MFGSRDSTFSLQMARCFSSQNREAVRKDETAIGRLPKIDKNNNKSFLQRSTLKILCHPSQDHFIYCWSYKFPNNVDPSLIYLQIIGFNTMLKTGMFPLLTHD